MNCEECGIQIPHAYHVYDSTTCDSCTPQVVALRKALRATLTWMGKVRSEVQGENDERRHIIDEGWTALDEH